MKRKKTNNPEVVRNVMNSELMRFFMLALVIVTSLALSSCVTRSKYNKLLAQYNEVISERDAMTSVAAGEEDEITALKTNYNALLSLLEAEIAAEEIEILELDNGIKLILPDDLIYKSGSTHLEQKGREVLRKVATHFSDKSYMIEVVGNTDNVPIGRHLAHLYRTNWELAAARATEVVRFLQENGVDPSHLEAVSRGQYQPVTSNATTTGRAKNRRTEIFLRPQ